MLRKYVHQENEKKRRVKLSQVIILHDSALPQTADLTKATSATVGWEMMNYPPYRKEPG
jgi:hypothetical protein